MKLRKTITAIGAALLIAGYFVTSQPITPRLALVSSLSVIVFALPSYWAVVKYCGKKRGLLLLAALGSYALIIESLAIHTGFPYGNFTYTDVLGNKIFGLTPWTVAFAYPPILLLTYWYARQRHTNKWQIWFSTAFDAMLIDLVLDPAAVRLGFWHWDKPGFFYGVPLINFLGWLLTGFLGAIILHIFFTRSFTQNFVRGQTSHTLDFFHNPICSRELFSGVSWRFSGQNSNIATFLVRKVADCPENSSQTREGCKRSLLLPVGLAYSGLAILWFWTNVNFWLQQWLPTALGLTISIFLVRFISAKKVQSSDEI